MALHPVGAADDQKGAVQHPEGSLRFGGEVHVAGGVQQGDFQIPGGQHGLLGEDGDAPLPLHGVRVQKGVPVVYPAQLPDGPALVQQGLRQGGFSGVHVGQQAQAEPPGSVFRVCVHDFRLLCGIGLVVQAIL